MQFENTVWLIAGLLVSAGLGWAFHAAQKGRDEALGRFASNHLLAKLTESVSPGRRRLKQALLVLAVFSVFVALARPQVGFRWEEAKRKGIDIMLAVDTSKSMLARDVAPNRLERSKLGIMDFVHQLGGDRVGLIPFAGDAFLMTPLTLDYGAFVESLRAMDTRTLPRGGTNIAAAIREADRAFVDDAKQKILVLITDGEDLEGEALSAAREAADKGITIHTIGVGTPAGELIPEGTARQGRFVKDGKGQMVKSRLDEAALREIASLTGGAYHPLGNRGEGLTRLYGEKLNLIPKQELSERMRKVPTERFEWALGLALLFLLLEFAIGDRKSRRAMRVPDVETADRRVPRTAGTVAPAAVLGALALLVVSLAQASPQEAQEAFVAGDYETAASRYEKASEAEPANQKLLFNLGVAAYRSKNFDKSADALRRTLESSDLELQNQAYYNLGNALYRKGQATEKSSAEETIQQWEQALESYDGAMKLDPQDGDARFNYEFVKKKLEELEKKQQQQNKNQDKKQDKKQDQQSKQEKKDQDKKDKNDKQDKQDEQKQQSQQNKNENQSGKDQKDQDQKSAKNQNRPDSGKNRDQQSGQGSKPEEKDGEKKDKQEASAKDGDEKKKAGERKGDRQKDRGEPKPDKGDIQQAQGQPGEKPGQQASASRGERRRPGEMSKEEAERLLDSLKRDDQQVSFAPDPKGSGKASRQRDYKDW